MQSKKMVIELKTQNMSILFAAVGNQQFVLFNTFHQDEVYFQSSYGWHLSLKTIKQIQHRFLKIIINTEKFPF